MKIHNRSSPLIIGMALFAMFFGSGNLIYPLYIGTEAETSWVSATLGFLIAAVLLPFLGVIAMVLYRGSYDEFFNSIGKKMGFILSLILLTVWIPLGSAPRCMTLAYASIDSYFANTPPLWLFSLIYSAFVFFIITRELGVLDILGKWITPLLLCCIGIICYQGFVSLSDITILQPFDSSLFVEGVVEGYNTMDLIASFFFSASVIHILNQSGSKISESLSLVLKSSIVGMMILAAVYVGLISLSAHYVGSLDGVPKDQLLAYLSQHILGPNWSILAILAIFLACFSTSVALIIAYTDFLHDEIFKEKQHPYFSILLALAITFIMSMFRLEGITFITAPILQVFYPLLLILIIYNIGKCAWNARKQVAAQ
jgi:LIVCS family branched-chain amino acid:cation transporter